MALNGGIIKGWALVCSFIYYMFWLRTCLFWWYNCFMDQVLICPKCQNSINTIDFFCRVCGYKLKEKPLSTSFLKQLSIYLISFLLPPLGLIPAIKYFRQDESKSKQIGIIAVIITLISVIISILLLQNFMDTFNSVLNGQSGIYENLSFWAYRNSCGVNKIINIGGK